MVVVRGVAAILFGIVALAMPKAGLLALVTVWGAYAIVDGVFALMLGVARGRAGSSWGFWIFQGLAGIGAGIVTFAWPTMTALVLLSVIAFWAILTGIAEIFLAIWLRRQITGEWLLATGGILSVAMGVLLLARPEAGTLALVLLIGAYAIVFGTLLIALGVQLYRWQRHHGGPALPAARATG
jgi:uncharacterized membrane protein HdeD (DUF308 family)